MTHDTAFCSEQNESYIICLDDDMAFLNSLKISLSNKFNNSLYNLLFLNSPMEALNVISDLAEDGEEIALIMTDQMMPEMGGVEFLIKARQISKNSMCVLMTGYSGLDSAVLAINENVLDKYLTKPILDLNDLIHTLKRLLNEYHHKNTINSQQSDIRSLYNFSNKLNSFESLDQIIEYTVFFIRDTLKCSRISLLLQENGVLTIKSGIGIPKDIMQSVRIPIGEKITGRVLQQQAPMLVTDIDQIPWLENRINPKFKSFISVPVVCAELFSSTIPLGVINVTNKMNNQPFTDHDLKALSFIANTASIAINNCKNRDLLEKSYFDTITALITALEARDKYTKGHSMRVMYFSQAIATKLGLPPEKIKTIKDAARLHDIGKIGIRDDILLKPGRLSKDEFDIIKQHPKISSAIVKPIDSLNKISDIIGQHHERYDGKGYPDGLKGETIHLGARIMAVADTFDAMTSDRPYRKRMTMEAAIAELTDNAGSQFDPQCVDALIECISDLDLDPDPDMEKQGFLSKPDVVLHKGEEER